MIYERDSMSYVRYITSLSLPIHSQRTATTPGTSCPILIKFVSFMKAISFSECMLQDLLFWKETKVKGKHLKPTDYILKGP